MRENRTRIAHPHRHILLIVSYCLVVRSLLRQLFFGFQILPMRAVALIPCLYHNLSGIGAWKSHANDLRPASRSAYLNSQENLGM